MLSDPKQKYSQVDFLMNTFRIHKDGRTQQSMQVSMKISNLVSRYFGFVTHTIEMSLDNSKIEKTPIDRCIMFNSNSCLGQTLCPMTCLSPLFPLMLR